MTRILIVDDDPGVRYTLEAVFKDAGHQVVSVPGGAEGLAEIAREAPDLVITDLAMPGMDGIAFLERARALDPQLPVVMITAHGSERRAVEAMKKGAWDYLKKPFDVDELQLTVATALERLSLRRENRELRAQLSLSRPIIHRSEVIARLMALIHRAAQRNVTVLVTGETGTGKELVASAIHELSNRAKRPLVRFNMAALPAGLAESELFGHEKGAFTGAVQAHKGLFERADGGVLFLDEIGDLPLELQAKLLRVLQDGEINPVGASETRRADVRVIAATHRRLEDEVKAARFREDLYYRLNVVHLHVPPLRERREDIPPLIAHFVAHASRRFEMTAPSVSEDVVQWLSARAWPGNVRELENAIERLIALSDGETITTADLAVLEGGASAATTTAIEQRSLRERVEAYEASVIREALAENGGNQSATARELKISRVTLIDKLAKYSLR